MGCDAVGGVGDGTLGVVEFGGGVEVGDGEGVVGIWGGDGTHLGSVFARDNVAEEEPKADYQDACKEAIDYSYVLYIVGFHLYIKLLPIYFLFV